jgi:hypothetical protein
MNKAGGLNKWWVITNTQSPLSIFLMSEFYAGAHASLVAIFSWDYTIYTYTRPTRLRKIQKTEFESHVILL